MFLYIFIFYENNKIFLTADNTIRFWNIDLNISENSKQKELLNTIVVDNNFSIMKSKDYSTGISLKNSYK